MPVTPTPVQRHGMHYYRINEFAGHAGLVEIFYDDGYCPLFDQLPRSRTRPREARTPWVQFPYRECVTALPEYRVTVVTPNPSLTMSYDVPPELI